MAARTTAEQVAQVIEIDSGATPSLDPFIIAASLLVDEHCASSEPTYTTERLTLIETWLAAHFVAIRTKVASSESIAGMSTGYESNPGQYLAATFQGQQALALDSNGGLARLQKGVENGNIGGRVGLYSLGRRRCGAYHES